MNETSSLQLSTQVVELPMFVIEKSSASTVTATISYIHKLSLLVRLTNQIQRKSQTYLSYVTMAVVNFHRFEQAIISKCVVLENSRSDLRSLSVTRCLFMTHFVFKTA